jgi:hypothetical protein
LEKLEGVSTFELRIIVKEKRLLTAPFTSAGNGRYAV